jgi:cyclophilin family peptidyl-prolyl cis-trans isomerase/HEAT repeat protein
MLMPFRFFLIAFFCVVITSCKDDASVSTNKFSDPVIVKIYDFKDRRLTDSLYQFLHDPNPIYRKEAVLAFASIQDSMALHKINRTLMSERDSSIKIATAFVLGQTPSIESERILLGAINREKDHDVLRELLESYGKTTHHWQLVQPALLEDSSKAEGLAWSIYRAGLRGKTDSVANRIASKFLGDKYSPLTRLGAAHFFNRGAKGFETYFAQLSKSATTDKSEGVRMATTAALRKIVTDSSLSTLIKILQTEKSINVKVNAVRALQSFDIAKTKTVLFKSLHDPQPNLAVIAAEVLKAKSDAKSVAEIKSEIETIENSRVKGLLYEILLKFEGGEDIVKTVIEEYNGTKEPFAKSFLLTSLQVVPSAFDFVADQMRKQKTDLVRSAAANALVEMHKQKGFTADHQAKFLKVLQEAIEEKEPVLIGILAGPLGDTTFGYKKIVKEYSFLTKARQVLSSPRDNESVVAVNTALEVFTREKQAPISNVYNHPIDWAFVQKIPSNQTAILHTTKGRITLKLFVEESPGSVENFMKLAKAGYFNKKYFHRVVPNFVIQSGCNRGDGWGGENYTIRSEFGLRRYTTGSVGMASSGKDTEGTQWFITHSPTPHLDGRYTIFAEVLEGMDVVNKIEMGDLVTKVELPKKSKR